MNLKILNTKEISKILEQIKSQFSIKELSLDFVFLTNEDNKVFISTKDIAKVDFRNLRINNIGLYFGKLEIDGFRPSIEGSQILGKLAKENVIEINMEDTKKWFKGEDLQTNFNNKGYVILKCKDDFLGSGKIKNNRIINYVDKGRRIRSDILYLNKPL